MTDDPRTDPMTHPTHDPVDDAPVEQIDQVDVRRNVPLSAAVGGLAGVLAAAFAARAFGGGDALDWVALAVLGLIAVVHLAAVVDGRAPLLVVDRHGVRLREGSRWQGIAWPDVDCLEHLPRRLPFHDGHLLVVGHDDQQLIVPLTLATRVVGADRDTLSDVLAGLADGRADVVEVVPGLEEEPPSAARPEQPRPAVLDDADASELARVRDGVAAGRSGDRPESMTTFVPPSEEEFWAAGRVPGHFRKQQTPADHIATDLDDDVVAPGRDTVPPARVEVQRMGLLRQLLGRGAQDPPTAGANALALDPRSTDQGRRLPEEEELRRSAGPEDASDPVWRIGAGRPQEEESATVVLDDVAVRPAVEPVIGPQLAAARVRLRLSVDQLSERTRIRPHVIEAIEVDDFGPCGGDFYARGHLRTLARVLGVEAAPLVATYDEKYADAPLDPRRVFEAELATGVGGSIRGTRGGRNWSVLIAAVMAAVLVWSIARLVMDGPVPVGRETPVLNQSGGISQGKTEVDPVPVSLTAAGGGARLVVRDGDGDVVFDGPLAFGQTSRLEVVPPVRIWSSDGSVTASVDGADATALGETGQEVTKTLVAPAP